MQTAIIGRAVRFQLTSESTTNQESKMRSLLVAVLCLSMAVCILANDFILGERQAGDYSVTNKTIFKPPIPIIPMRARIGIKCLLNETITYVQISSIDGNDIKFYQISGDVGMTSLMVMAMGNPGEGLWLKVEGYCIDPNSVTTEAPTTTTTAVPTTTTAVPTTTTAVPTTTSAVPTTTTTLRPTTTAVPTTTEGTTQEWTTTRRATTWQSTTTTPGENEQ
ncbi:putative lipase ATG15 [Harpegnathos saltator]|uniref:putative lipase ATG15 n=1 Tax=Harpegnathos saltator TaxID=610380 RepID=UPI000DBEE9CA|nr:putative lipase ATG15 [Harpegnathos saltator]